LEAGRVLLGQTPGPPTSTTLFFLPILLLGGLLLLLLLTPAEQPAQRAERRPERARETAALLPLRGFGRHGVPAVVGARHVWQMCRPDQQGSADN
jgi:hypothetical protein